MPNDEINFVAEETDNQELTKDEILSRLSVEEEEEEPEKEEEASKEEEEKVEEEEEEKEEKEEKEEEKEEELELTVPVRRSEILKKYPNLFKEFPYLERAYYREQQYTELLPTLDDAKEAVSKAQIFDKIHEQLLNGTAKAVLRVTKEADPEAFNNLVDNYLADLAEVDEKAYNHVLGNILRSTIVAMVREGDKMQNDALKHAALILNQFVFGTSDFEPPKRLGKPREEENALKAREQEFVKRQFETARDDLTSRVTNILKSTIEAHIDPRNTMTEYIRKVAVRDAFEDLENLIAQDERFRTILDKLWERAFKENFSRASIDRIRSAYLSKAKTLLPSVIKKARNEALRGMGKRVREEEEPKKGPLPVGKAASTKKTSSPKEIPKNISTLDFLLQD